jgi:hypothetical protein
MLVTSLVKGADLEAKLTGLGVVVIARKFPPFEVGLREEFQNIPILNLTCQCIKRSRRLSRSRDVPTRRNPNPKQLSLSSRFFSFPELLLQAHKLLKKIKSRSMANYKMDGGK